MAFARAFEKFFQKGIDKSVLFCYNINRHERWCGSMAEQLICNQQVVGSTPITSSIYWGEFPSGQRGQTVNLLSLTSLVRIQLPPPKNKPDPCGRFYFLVRFAERTLIFEQAAYRACGILRHAVHLLLLEFSGTLFAFYSPHSNTQLLFRPLWSVLFFGEIC